MFCHKYLCTLCCKSGTNGCTTSSSTQPIKRHICNLTWTDGSLTILELAALLRSLGLKPSGDQMHSFLANMDSNGNGCVEFDELVNAILPDMNDEILVNQEQLLEVFRSFDRDGNGYITAAELAKSMAKMGQPLTYKELTEMIKEADTDGDGVISFNEFASITAKSASNFLGLPSS